jgi:hypothetical protein
LENERAAWEKELFLGLESLYSDQSGNCKYGLLLDHIQAYQMSREYFGDDPDARPQTPLLQILADQLEYGETSGDYDAQEIASSRFCRLGTNLFLLDADGLLMVSINTYFFFSAFNLSVDVDTYVIQPASAAALSLYLCQSCPPPLFSSLIKKGKSVCDFFSTCFS